ncbi:MAG: YbhB/YbcL family Raf kinase inhibitor-like protein [Ruminococcaceae bacterium]|nr:YbhB/YbcL family Raf kinase inhibitor-like protein [Oscillospiraceae bacterium]
MKSSFLIFVMILILLLTACSGKPGKTTGEIPEPSKPQPEKATEAPASMDGMVNFEYIAEAAERLAKNPEEFGSFFAEYKEDNREFIADFKEPAASRNGYILEMDRFDLIAKQPADGNRVLICFEQFPNDEASLDEEFGVFLDCMAQLPEENIPESLIEYDTYIKIKATPKTVAYYNNTTEIPAIKWTIDESYENTESGIDVIIESFEGSDPPDIFTASYKVKYEDGTYPMDLAVECALKFATGMRVSSLNVFEGEIRPQHGMYGEQMDGDVPTLSFPLSIQNAPKDTVCYAIKMTDPDSVPLCGYEWYHWTVVNLTDAELPENASIDMASEMIQGKNDFGKIGYGGPTPPDKPHTYVITVYALDSLVELENGFAKEEFDEAIEGHILAEASMEGVYYN